MYVRLINYEKRQMLIFKESWLTFLAQNMKVMFLIEKKKTLLTKSKAKNTIYIKIVI